MFANFLQLFARKTSAEYDQSFVHDVHVHQKPARNRSVERMIALGWVLIALKSALVWWACATYPVPFHPLWLIAPTVAFGALCTLVYWKRF